MKKRILVTGCAGVRLTLSCDRLPYSGESALGESYSYSPDLRGAAAALALSRLGVDSVLLSSVGSDSNGTKLISMLSDGGVDTRFMVRIPQRTTSLSVTLRETDAGERTIIYPGASEFMSESAVEEAFNCYPDGVLLRLDTPASAAAAVEVFARGREIPLYVSASDMICGGERQFLPESAKFFIGDAASIRAITGINPSTPDASLKAVFALAERIKCECTVFRMSGGSIYIYDGRMGRILDRNSRGRAFCDVFAPAMISEYIRGASLMSAANFALRAVTLWEDFGETFQKIPTLSDVRHDEADS